MNNNEIKEDIVSKHANEIAKSLLENFNPTDQRGVLVLVREIINENYENRLKSASENLKELEVQYSTFRGEEKVSS